MPDTKSTIRTLNQLQAEGLISKYALGGAFGALFYLEPSNTEDIDVFIHLNPLPGTQLVSLGPIHERLRDLGYSDWSEDKIVVDGWPVQFLPATTALEREALEAAREHQLESDLATWVPTAEHLMAIALNLGRPKDKFRLEQFYRQKAFDSSALEKILSDHELDEKWRRILPLFADQPTE